jgi:NADPH:quinone reductase
MNAIQISQFGDASVMRIADVPEPRPRPGEVLVDVKAAGVNYADILMREGRYSAKLPFPFVPGFEAAGVIAETGDGVADWKPGQRVMGTVLRETSGCYAERAVMPAWLLLPIPEPMSFEEGAAFSEAFITASLALRTFGRLHKGESVLIHAAGGGVGTAAVQLAHAMGARVFATAGSNEKLKRVRELGADVLINYVEWDFAAEVNAATESRGVDLILDSVGGDVFTNSFKCLASLGRVVVFGQSSGKMPTVDARSLMAGNCSVSGFGFGKLSVIRQDIVRECMQTVTEFLARGEVHSVIGRVFPLAEAAAAHQLISSRGNFGKVVLTP